MKREIPPTVATRTTNEERTNDRIGTRNAAQTRMRTATLPFVLVSVTLACAVGAYAEGNEQPAAAATARSSSSEGEPTVDAERFTLGKRIFEGKQSLKTQRLGKEQLAAQREHLLWMHTALSEHTQKVSSLPTFVGRLSDEEPQALHYYLSLRHHIPDEYAGRSASAGANTVAISSVIDEAGASRKANPSKTSRRPHLSYDEDFDPFAQEPQDETPPENLAAADLMYVAGSAALSALLGTVALVALTGAGVILSTVLLDSPAGALVFVAMGPFVGAVLTSAGTLFLLRSRVDGIERLALGVSGFITPLALPLAAGACAFGVLGAFQALFWGSTQPWIEAAFVVGGCLLLASPLLAPWATAAVLTGTYACTSLTMCAVEVDQSRRRSPSDLPSRESASMSY